MKGIISMIIYNFEKTYEILENSEDRNEVLGIIRSLLPDAEETYKLIAALDHNSICDAEIRLELSLKVNVDYNIFRAERLKPTYQDIFECSDNTDLMMKVFRRYKNKYGESIALRIKDKDAIEEIYNSSDIEICRAVLGNCNAREEFLRKVIAKTGDSTSEEIAERTLAIVNIKSAKAPDYIEEIYETAPYEVKYAALSNPCNRKEFLRKIISDEKEIKSLVEVAKKTLEISST